jgi:hypothetical protein
MVSHGLGSYTITKLINEAGPTEPVTLQWASYYDAADQVGPADLGGIHRWPMILRAAGGV